MWLFKQLLRLYPVGFRGEYSELMQRQFADEWRECGGWLARVRLLVLGISEILWLWPQLAWAEFVQDAGYCWRSWRQRSAVTLLAVGSLALAIGVSTGVLVFLAQHFIMAFPSVSQNA